MYAAARISKLFGTDGGLLLNLYTTFPDDFDAETTPLFAVVDNLHVPLWCERFERRGMSGATVRFADIDTPRRAEEFAGCELFIDDAGEAAESDEFMLEDLIGFGITANGRRGRISDFYDNDVNPLFGITFEDADNEILIPAVEEFIAGIDFEKRHMKLVLPEGLTEL